MHHRIRILPEGVSFSASDQESVLDAAIRAGLRVRYSCRNGVCELCDGRLLAGQVNNTRDHRRYEGDVDAPPDLYLCRLTALSDCEFEMTGVTAPDQIPLQRLSCRIVAVELLNHDVWRVRLKLPAGRRPDYLPGQYLSVILPGAEPAFFSIASAPHEPELELHIQAAEGWASALNVITHLKTSPSVDIELPRGKAWIQPALLNGPLVIVAAGTGFAQAKSVIAAWLQTGAKTPVHVFWGGRRRVDLYWEDLPLRWQVTHPNFTATLCHGDTEDNEWLGHHDQLVELLMSSCVDWATTKVLASGSPAMVYTLMDALLAAGLPASAFLSDVLEYAPR